MLPAELTEISRVNDLLLESSGLHDSAFEPSLVNPLLHLFGTNMKSLSQGVFREPVLTHAAIGVQPPQHGVDRSRRATE
jgi:hypothetical protein